jgi:two-component system, OmpR family, sensor histidine kinase QseC
MRVNPSLRRRLTWYVVVTLLTLTTLSGIAIYKGTTREVAEVFDASLVQSARILDGLLSRANLDSNSSQLKQALERTEHSNEYEKKLFLAVLDTDGSVLLHSRQAPQLPVSGLMPGFSSFEYQGKKWFTYVLPSSRDDLLIVVGESSRVRAEITENIGGGLLIPLILLLPPVLWLLWHIVGVALKPLQAVTDQVLQLDLLRLKAIDVDGVPREISPLVDALNQMISDLDAAYLRERRFVSDASHELRNPLASLLINVDNAIEESQDSEAIDSLRDMKLSIKRLSHLVSQLLVLSHLEKAGAPHAFEMVDLARLCAGTVASLQPGAAAKSIALEFIPSDTDCSLPGEISLLESLVANLVDNAITHGGPGCRVEVQCRRVHGQICLSVDDSGPGLDAEQRAKALGRFYRAGDTNSLGAGLGLSIVENIARSHSGLVELSESKLGGLCVTIRFDLA